TARAAYLPLHPSPTRRSSDLLHTERRHLGLRADVGDVDGEAYLGDVTGAAERDPVRVLDRGRLPLALGPRAGVVAQQRLGLDRRDRKSTRLNSSHVKISYAVF